MTSRGDPPDVAHYFLSTFLGFRFQRHPRIVTEGFVTTVRRFISAEVADPDTKLRYMEALSAEVNSHQAKIRPMDFIQNHIDEPERPVLLKRLDESGIPQASFDKDVTGLGRLTSRTTLKTASGITIAGPVDVIHDRVSAVTVDGESRIIVRDRLTEV